MGIFFICLAVLIIGYFTYGSFVDKLIGPQNDSETPAIRLQDGVDYVPMPWYKVFLIQFLNIAGSGPIFGAISGALFGPIAFLWIALGCVFAGAVHDYLTGIISVRHNGASVSELVAIYLGNKMKNLMIVFSIFLLILIGTILVWGPAELLHSITGANTTLWVIITIAYYVLATILPVDKIIGKIYPLFGAALLLMLAALCMEMIYNNFNGNHLMMELTFKNLHPAGLGVVPFLFTTISCGAISGFHATQSPLMARCIKHESECRKVFYGAMIMEGIVTLIWCAVAIAFFGDTLSLSKALNTLGPAGVVGVISQGLLDKMGIILAVLGVVACPITSGDTAVSQCATYYCGCFASKAG